MSSNTQTVKEFFVNDLVYKFDDRKRIKFGIVTDSYEESDSDESSGLQKGQLLVSWNNAVRKQICRQNKLYLMNRHIVPGDIVRRLENGKETQRGYCKTTKQFASAQVVDSDKVIDHIAENRLCFIKPFDVGDAISFGDKFGRIQGIDQMIRMQSKCGSVVEVRSSINYSIKDHWSHSVHGTYLSPGYPGQMVTCTPMHLKDAKWIKKSKVMKRKMEIRQKFTIQSINICLAEVWWYLPNGQTEYGELNEEEIKKLKVIYCPEYLGICDRHLLQIKPTDVLLKKKEWIKKKSLQYLPKRNNSKDHCNLNNSNEEQLDESNDWLTEEDEDEDNNRDILNLRIKQRKKNCPPELNKFSCGSVVAVEILCTDAKATIIWQDGSEEVDIPTTELYYSVSLDDHELFPGEWVVSSLPEIDLKYGVIQKVKFLERTAEVKWFSFTETDKAPQYLHTSEVSVYDLKKHAKYVFRPGSVVRSTLSSDNRMGKVVDSCPEGFVIVSWLGGIKENCWPQNIELIPESEGFEFSEDFASDNELSGGGNSWETESIESFDGDVIDDINLQMMAVKVDFIRSRINYLKETFRQHNITNNFHFLKDLFCIYAHSSYLDKYLETSFFSLESKHFQVLLHEAKEKASAMGIEMTGRLFSKVKNAENETLQKMISLESKVNAQIIENSKDAAEGQTSLSALDTTDASGKSQENICIELLLMLKMRLDLVYAELISRIGGSQALSVLTYASEENMKPSLSTATLNDSLLTPQELTSPKLPKLFNASSKNNAFCILEQTLESHHYFSKKFEPKDLLKFVNVLQKEYKLMKESLPAEVWVKAYEDRIDLLSLMIRGPDNTPYQDGLFLFDIQLSTDYPRHPPSVFFISYIGEALNPNLYVEGKVCVSLLGTWMGRGTEVWSSNSTLLQLIVSIQGLILVPQPYFNEAGYEKQMHTQAGYENSRTYNEFVVLKLVQSMTELLHSVPKVFETEIIAHFEQNGEKMCDRMLKYCDDENPIRPEFPLFPVSKGLKLSLRAAIKVFREKLRSKLLAHSNAGQSE